MRHNDIRKIILALEKKKCNFQTNGLANIIDISKAESLGNKSWGKIEYLVNYCNYILIGRATHKRDKVEEKKPIIMRECIMKTSCIH